VPKVGVYGSEWTPALTSSCQELAEGARFELAVGFPTTVFKTVTLNHSDTPPGGKDRIAAPLRMAIGLPAMELGLGVAAGPDPDLLAPLAGEAEALGYVSIWSNDTPAGEGLLQLSRWAENSQTIDLCVGAISLDRHRPSDIAERVHELGLPLGRLVLALGAGFDSHPLASVRSGVEELRGLLPGMRLAVAAMGPNMCRLAGEIGDAVLLNWVTPKGAAEAREVVLQGAREAGKEATRVMGHVRVAAGEDAQDRLATEAAMYRQMPHYARHFEAMGADPSTIGVTVEDPASLPAHLAAYGALDVTVVRVLSERSVESVLFVARAAVGKAVPG
jgi:alkanesulfonate monooxygenase SsuD/methylene tetrahydromethanopterin reductase-like flavin-dependent oxidoreductase (luciferase family)